MTPNTYDKAINLYFPDYLEDLILEAKGKRPWLGYNTPAHLHLRQLVVEGKLRDIHERSLPVHQFKSQTIRECAKLSYLYLAESPLPGRRPTLEWDKSCDLRVNAENNVRKRWVEQGIWAEEWGQAWPPGTIVWHCWPPREQFFVENGRILPTIRDHLGGLWGHELTKTSSSSGPSSSGPEIPIIQVTDPEASRPMSQYFHQVAMERVWLKDDLDHRFPLGHGIDLHERAREIVKRNWMEDGAWDYVWGDLPGHEWMHERVIREAREAREAKVKQKQQKPKQQQQASQPSSASHHTTSSGGTQPTTAGKTSTTTTTHHQPHVSDEAEYTDDDDRHSSEIKRPRLDTDRTAEQAWQTRLMKGEEAPPRPMYHPTREDMPPPPPAKTQAHEKQQQQQKQQQEQGFFPFPQFHMFGGGGGEGGDPDEVAKKILAACFMPLDKTPK